MVPKKRRKNYEPEKDERERGREVKVTSRG